MRRRGQRSRGWAADAVRSPVAGYPRGARGNKRELPQPCAVRSGRRRAGHREPLTRTGPGSARRRRERARASPCRPRPLTAATPGLSAAAFAARPGSLVRNRRDGVPVPAGQLGPAGSVGPGPGSGTGPGGPSRRHRLCLSSPPGWCRAGRRSCGPRAAGSRCAGSRWCWRTPSSSPRVAGRYGPGWAGRGPGRGRWH